MFHFYTPWNRQKSFGFLTWVDFVRDLAPCRYINVYETDPAEFSSGEHHFDVLSVIAHDWYP